MLRDFTSPTLRIEVAATLRLAAPVALVQMGMMLMGTVDVMMLGRVSEEALAAGALGNAMALALLVFPMGILMALDPLAAQAHGAGDKAALGRHFQQALVLAGLMSVPVALLMWNGHPLFRALGQAPGVSEGASAYLRAVIPGQVAMVLYTVGRHTLQAMSIIRSAVVAMIVANLVNLLANWVLIFGHWGFPPLGVVGSAWATSCSRSVMCLVLVLGAWRTLAPMLAARAEDLGRPGGYRTFLRLGLPIGTHLSLELWLFAGVTLLMGRLGARAVAGHQVALNLAALSFMLSMGIAGAAATRVGNAVGRGETASARRAAAISLGLTVTLMTCFALLFSLAPNFLSRLYSPEPGVVAMAASLLPLAALFQVFDGLQVVGAGVLRGAADTRVPAGLVLVGYWVIGLPLGVWLTFVLGFGPRGLWWGLTAGLMSVAALLLVRIFHRFRHHIAAV